MSTEERRHPEHLSLENVFTRGTLIASDEICPTSQNKTLECVVFGLALAIASEPSKLAQLHQLLAHLQSENAIPEDFVIWATGQIDERLTSMALEYAHDGEIMLQILSFKCSTLSKLMQNIEDLYRQEKITQRVYARAKLSLMEQ